MRIQSVAVTLRTLAAAMLCTVAGVACAQFPERPVRIVVSGAPGTPGDILARTLAEGLQTSWGRPVVVETRLGVNGIVAAEAMVRSAADGHTLLIHPASVVSFNPTLYKNLSYDPVRDFAPISQLAALGVWILVNPKLEARSVRDLIALAKKQPGNLSYASSGSSSGLPYIASILIRNVTGIDVTFIPYSNQTQAVTDVIAGRLQFGFAPVPSSIGFVRAGSLRALAVLSPRRIVLAPEVPTIAEAGLPEATGEAWSGLSGRAGTPAAIVKKIHDDTVNVLKQPENVARLSKLGFEVIANTPEEFTDVIHAELAKWGKVIRDNKIRAD